MAWATVELTSNLIDKLHVCTPQYKITQLTCLEDVEHTV